LNRTSFNGIYRENLKGIYNVPYGNKQYKSLFDYENLRLLNEHFNDAIFSTCDFEKALLNVKEGDLVFLDPPYTVAHENNGFVKYNQNIFSWEDQVRLRDAVKLVSERGGKYIVTNASHESIRELFKDVGVIHQLERFSVVGGKDALRGKYHEFLITNV
jgi:DNA adenine methylase